MSKHPSSSKPLADLRKKFGKWEKDSFRQIPGLPVDDLGNPTTNLSLREFDHMGGKVIAGFGSDTKIHDEARLIRTYNRPGDAFQKVASKSSAGLEARVYRDRTTGQILEQKTKVSDAPRPKEPSFTLRREALANPATPKENGDRQTAMKKQGQEMTGSAAREKARADKEKANELKKQGQEMSGSAAREQVRAAKARAEKEKVEEMKKQGQEMTKPKDKLTTMGENAEDTTGKDARATEQREKKLEPFRENKRLTER
ncbi:hypothetical protein [Hymenobacter sp. GOD-10R]|uniref:hypothetical protein n=1 Tax=Hymenobacter sp. GOD-10R TaxID=3093922 RepID=UPI002D76672A|nr:hypothetical protein [Hymenobacter sp. GOD-10R]WRQ31655.1 hypothetical protein SD425_27875 [Hymenobacter sp. GOD-10R]